MGYKTITTRETFDVSNQPMENSLEQIKSYLENGFKIAQMSCTHIPRQNQVYGDPQETPTKIFMITTYLLFKE